MPTIQVKDITGSQKGTLNLKPEIFETEINKSVIRESLCLYLANQRQGTHATKTRGMVSGGGKKPWRQKGTGRARVGSSRNPVWRHGGTAFGPQPRDYSFKVNKKKKQKAFCSCLSDLAANERLMVVSDIVLEKPKTKELLNILNTLKIPEYDSVLILTHEKNQNLYLSGRNITNVVVSPVNNINIFDLLNSDWVIATEETIKKLEETLS